MLGRGSVADLEAGKQVVFTRVNSDEDTGRKTFIVADGTVNKLPLDKTKAKVSIVSDVYEVRNNDLICTKKDLDMFLDFVYQTFAYDHKNTVVFCRRTNPAEVTLVPYASYVDEYGDAVVEGADGIAGCDLLKREDCYSYLVSKFGRNIYGVYAHNYNKHGCCPNCGSDNIDYEDRESDYYEESGHVGNLIDYCSCNACNCQWSIECEIKYIKRKLTHGYISSKFTGDC